MQRIRAAAKKRRKVLFEPLEPRILLSSDPFSYTAAANTAVDLTLRLQEVSGIDTLQLINNSDQSVLQSQALADTSAVEITGSDLDDRFTIDLDFDDLADSLPLTFTGGTGNDTLRGPDGDNTWDITGFNTGTLNDQLLFTDLENLVGGSGADAFHFVHQAVLSRTIDSGLGVNTMDYSAYGSGVTVDLSEGTATGTGGIANIRNVIGSPGNDSLVGDDFDNELTGGAGFDTLTGGLGNDTYTIEDNWQDNTLDELEDEGRDTLDFSGVTTDLTITIDADSVISVEDGSGNVANFENFEIFIGGTGDDHYVLEDNWGYVTLHELEDGGNDVLDFSNVTNNLNVAIHEEGGISATELDDEASGLDLVENIEDLIGGTGDDTFYLADQASLPGTIDGGPGNNTIDYSEYLTDVAVDLSTGTAHGTQGIENIHNITGGMGDDTLIGDAGDNILIGGFGDDLLLGGAGNDAITGSDGIDTVSYASLQKSPDEIDQQKGVSVDLGSKVEQLVYTIEIPNPADPDSPHVTEEFDKLAEIENLIGSDFNDILTGSLEFNEIFGGVGDDILVGRAGDDFLDGGLLGSDTVSYFQEAAGVTADLSEKTATDGSGNIDTLENIENLTGSQFDDILYGDDAVNILTGLEGDDTLAGGYGADIYAFGDDWGKDTINDAFGTSHDGIGNTLDFSSATDDLTFTFHADGSVSVQDGENTLSTFSFMPESFSDTPDGISSLTRV
jgi:Ca2+-binding RTX toxin-like protein